jgi:di/tripeptidase
MKLLKRLYEIHSPSGQEKRIRNFIENYISENIPDARFETDAIGNLYVVKGKSETYPCVAAHLDQVQRFHSKDFRAVETRDIIFGYSPSKRRQEGLGADDKNGIWIALQCLKKFDAIKTVFFVGEEVGCVGSNAADLAFFSDCRFVIEPDRRGHGDLITQISWQTMCSKEFLADIQPERFGYTPEEGMMTDIEILRDNGLPLSCINLSCGYYEPHTDHEFTVKKDLLNCLDFVQHIIEYCTGTYPHAVEPYLDSFQCGNGYYQSDDYDYYVGMVSEIILANPDFTAEEAWEVYYMNFPDITKEEFEEIFTDCWESGMDEPAPPKPVGKRRGRSKKHRYATDIAFDPHSYTNLFRQ